MSTSPSRPLWALALCALAARAASARSPALVLRGGRVFLEPGIYAQALAVSGDRITDVGSDAGISKLVGPRTRVVELKGRAVVPGFHDAGVRLLRGALLSEEVDVSKAETLDDIRAQVQRYAAAHPDGDWILGRGWNQARLSGPPTRQELDAAISTRPVALADDEGEALWLNTTALRRCRITRATPKLNLGRIVLDASGEPAGLLEGRATGLAKRWFPKPTQESELAALRNALALARSRGVTAVDAVPDPDDPPLADELALWTQLYRSGQTTLRLFVYGSLDDASEALKLRRLEAEIPRTRFGVVGAAGSLDGTVASRSAALLAPYFDAPKQRGEPLYLQWRLNELVRSANERGLQAALGATGDRAVRMALDACAKSVKRAQDKGYVLPRYPCRLEPVELVSPADLPRFGALSAAAVVEPERLLFDSQVANDYPNRLGDRARAALPWRSLERAGATVAFASGWPAHALSPLDELWAAVERRFRDGSPPQGWQPQERVALESALVHATLDPARVVGRDEELGSIKPGKIADVVVLDRDIFAAPPSELPETRVDLTVYNGRVVYDRAAR